LEKLIEISGIDQAHSSKTPFVENLSSRSDDKVPVDKIRYLELVGLLNYLGTLTRPDILYALSRVSQKCSKPTRRDLRRVFRIFFYLNGTRDLGITFKPGPIQSTGWVDASHIHYRDGKGHFGYAFALGPEDGTFFARSQKMKLVTPAGSTESEFVALYEAACEIQFLRGILCELGFSQLEPTVLFEDNVSAIHMVHGRGKHHKRRHINVKYHYTRELVKNGSLQVLHCRTSIMRADILTKPLGSGKFHTGSSLLLNL
jgi:hypothetical protein